MYIHANIPTHKKCKYLDLRKPYEEQLQIKHNSICKVMGKFRRKMTNAQFMNIPFLKWLPTERGAANLKSLCPVLGIIPSPIINGYRNNVSFSIGYNEESKLLTVGFQLGRTEDGAVSIGSYEDVPTIDDVISKRIANCVQQFVRQQFAQYKYDSFNKKNHNGIWRKLTVKLSNRTKEFIVILEIQNQQISDKEYEKLKEDLLKFLLNESALIKKESEYLMNGILILVNNTVSVANANEANLDKIYGNNHYYERICNLKFRVSATSFFQINTISAERLYETAAQWAINNEQKTVLFDVCCGTGTIGLCIAKLCGNQIKKVIGVEIVQNAVDDAIYNAQMNGFENAQFIAGRAEQTLKKALDEEVDDNDYVVAVLDPPRCGVHKDVCKLIRMQRRIQRVIYISCNPNSCIVDAQKLCQSPSKKMVGTPFKPIKAIGVDLFPHTEHVEMIMHLERCEESEVDWTKVSKQARESQRKYLYAQKLKNEEK